MATILDANISTNKAHSNLDSNYGPYQDVNAAYDALKEQVSPIPGGGTIPSRIAPGLTVGINTAEGIVEYWWKDGVAKSDLVEKQTPGGGGLPDGMKVVTFHPNGGSGYQEPMFSTTNNVVLPECKFTPNGVSGEFKGWGVNATTGDVVNPNATVGLSDPSTVYYAIWKPLVPDTINIYGESDENTYIERNGRDITMNRPLQVSPGTTIDNITISSSETGFGINPNDVQIIGVQTAVNSIVGWRIAIGTFTAPNNDVTIKASSSVVKPVIIDGEGIEHIESISLTSDGVDVQPENGKYYVLIDKEVVINFTPDEPHMIDGEPSGVEGIEGAEWDSSNNQLKFIMPNDADDLTISVNVIEKPVKFGGCYIVNVGMDNEKDIINGYIETQEKTKLDLWVADCNASGYAINNQIKANPLPSAMGITFNSKGNGGYVSDVIDLSANENDTPNNGITLLMPKDNLAEYNINEANLIFIDGLGQESTVTLNITKGNFTSRLLTPSGYYILMYVFYNNGEQNFNKVSFNMSQI